MCRDADGRLRISHQRNMQDGNPVTRLGLVFSGEPDGCDAVREISTRINAAPAGPDPKWPEPHWGALLRVEHWLIRL